MSIIICYRRTHRLSMRIVKNGDVHVSAPYGLSRDVVMAFIQENQGWIERARQRREARDKAAQSFYDQLPLATQAQRNEATARAEALIVPMVEKHARAIGVGPQTVYFSATTSRWGVCYPKRSRIGFSLYLLLLPEWCVEHVVVHELCHLIEPSHNERFYALMDRYYPRWREARAETRRLSTPRRRK